MDRWLEETGLREAFRGQGLPRVSAIPLFARGRLIGVLAFAGRRPVPPRYRDPELVALLGKQLGSLVDGAQLLRQLEQHTQSLAVLEERERIAREMHDSLAQVLGYLHLKAKAALKTLGSGEGEKVRAQLEEMAEAAQSAYADVREAILGLRESISEKRGLKEALKSYIRGFERQSGIPVRFLLAENAVAEFPPATEIQLLRVIQEALTNVRKHAQASQVTISFQRDGDNATILVADDGRGFSPEETLAKRQCFGLASMVERIKSINGTIQIDSRPGGGTRIIVRLPIQTSEGRKAGEDPSGR
jgi:signal transduction histidine kinase